MPTPRILAIDCGAAHVACGLFRLNEHRQLELERLSVETLAIDPNRDSEWTEMLGTALTKIVQRERFPLRECVVSVPGHLALTKFVTTPAVEPGIRDRVVQFEASQNIPYALSDVAWGYLTVADDGVDLDLMVSAAKLDAMEALCAAVESAGLTLIRAETASLAVWRAWKTESAENFAPVLIVDVGARSTSCLFISSTGVYVRTLPMAGNSITHTVAKDLRVEFSRAEQLKRQVLGEESNKPMDERVSQSVNRAVGSFVNRLQLEMTRSRLSYSRQKGAELPQRVLLTGAGSRLPNLAKQVSESMDLPAACIEGLKSIKVSSPGGVKETDRLLVLVGLALSLVEKEAGTLDLLPPDRREAHGWRRRRLGWLATAGLIILSLGCPLTYYHLSAVREQKRVVVLDRQLGPWRLLESKNFDNLELIKQLREQIAIIEPTARGRANWIEFLADVQSRLVKVGDVWLERMQVLAVDSKAGARTAVGGELRLKLTGRLLDIENPQATMSEATRARLDSLFRSFGQSSFVERVEDDRYDVSQPGVLRFELTLVKRREKRL